MTLTALKGKMPSLAYTSLNSVIYGQDSMSRLSGKYMCMFHCANAGQTHDDQTVGNSISEAVRVEMNCVLTGHSPNELLRTDDRSHVL